MRLAPLADFANLDGLIHLAASGESPPLRIQQQALAGYYARKGISGAGAPQNSERQGIYDRCKASAAALFGVRADEMAFTGSVSQAASQVALSLPWRPGDNVVVEDVEFLSSLLPWSRLRERGVELRVVRHLDWTPDEAHISAAVDRRTRVIAVSQVNYLTGVQHNLEALRAITDGVGARLYVDASHAAGPVPVPASLCDFVTCATYKWLLGTQDVALLYWNRTRVPELEPALAGWRSVQGGPAPGGDPLTLPWKDSAERLEGGNPPWLAISYLEPALAYLVALGVERIAAHVRTLSTRLHDGLTVLGLPVATPADPRWRAGSVCFWTEQPEAFVAAMWERRILITGYDGRVRISPYIWNDEADVDAVLQALAEILPALSAPAP